MRKPLKFSFLLRIISFLSFIPAMYGQDAAGDRFEANVQVDISRKANGQPSLTKDPNLIRKTITLNTLLVGDAYLYQSNENGNNAFYYKLGRSKIKPLIFKEYTKDGKVVKNNEYKEQLLNAFSVCNTMAYNDFKNATYDAESLNELFAKFNGCSTDVSSLIFDDELTDLRFNIKGGIASANYNLVNSGRADFGSDLGNETSWHGELEAEVILGNTNKSWAFFMGLSKNASFEGSFERDLTSINTPTETVTLTYDAIALVVGSRYYIHLIEDQLDISLHAGYAINFISDLNVDYEFTSLDLGQREKRQGRIVFGVGTHYDRFFLEARMDIDNDLFEASTFSLKNNVFSLSAGVHLF